MRRKFTKYPSNIIASRIPQRNREEGSKTYWGLAPVEQEAVSMAWDMVEYQHENPEDALGYAISALEQDGDVDFDWDRASMLDLVERGRRSSIEYYQLSE